MQWGDTMDRTKREICVAFGLPESVVSDASGQTFDNADADYAKAWEHTMLPLFGMLDAQLDVLTPGGYDDDTYLAHDVSDVWVLGRHQRAREDRALNDFNNGALTIDEYREICDRDPWDVPATRVLWIPSGRLAVADEKRKHDGDAEAAGAAPLGGQPPQPDPAALGGAGIPNALPPGFGLDPQADLMGDGQDTGTDPAVAGPPAQRAIAQAGRRPAGAAVDAAPERPVGSR
jgi:hypothetical protein